ncbi:UNVERIFIED_CONTAM: hypothetical protein GTU68_015033 [Idotea baltica]|nr:hypothetical protein [Idotea baltica]
MADDIGYSDIGCYGAEIETPNLDRLAKGGMRFREFYNMAKCNPTRSSLITGLFKGNEQAISFVPLLREAGYSAVISGKEHFDKWVPPHCYFAETFEKSFTFWATTEYFVPPSGKFQRPFFLNGKEMNAAEIKAEILPKYKTDFITDYGLEWLDGMMAKDDPFFLFLPYHAAHYPLQARPEDIAKYRGKYLGGWDEIRAARFERMKEIGILEPDVELSPAEGNTNKKRGSSEEGWDEIRNKWPSYYAWDSMTEKEQDEKDLEMAVFAATIDRMDRNIGRVLDRLEAAGEMENTLILFFTDNGSCPFDSNKDFDVPPGPPESYRCLSPPWANVGNTPFRLYKQNGHEGGANTHFIAHWPKGISPNQVTDQVGHVVDIFPTFLDLAGVSYPKEFNSKKTLTLDGSSLLPVFKGEERPLRQDLISGFTENFRMYRSGDWKIVKQNGADWELYNLLEDRTEINNLALNHPEKVEALASQYANYVERKEAEYFTEK